MAPAGHCLEVLGTHDRPHACPAGKGVQVIHYAGEAHLVLARGPDLGYLYPRITQLFTDGVLTLQRLQSPQVTGVPEFGLSIPDEKVNRPFCPVLHDDGIEPSHFEFGSPVAASLSFTECPGKG